MEQPSGITRYLALLAHPVDHVKAPSFMNPGFEKLGLNWFITPMHVQPENLKAVVRGLQKVDNIMGVNLTIPHKETMADLCDELGPNARLVGAVNAVRFDGGRLIGEIFDGQGLLIGQQQHGIELQGRSALIAGAGGAARAVGLAYAQSGVSRLRITNRTMSRAEKLVDDIRSAMPGIDIDTASNDPTGIDVICNCTSLGLHEGDDAPVNISKLQKEQDVVDVIAVRTTEMMAAAEAVGCKVMGGVPMAVGQLAAFAEFFDPA